MLPKLDLCKNCPCLLKRINGSLEKGKDLIVYSCNKLKSKSPSYKAISKTIFYGRKEKELEQMPNAEIPVDCNFYLEHFIEYNFKKGKS